MYIVTSSLFLPSLVAYLSPASSALLLREHFLTALTRWVARGRPALARRCGPPPPAPGSPSLAPAGTMPNPWLALIEAALVHPDGHVANIAHSCIMHRCTASARQGIWLARSLHGWRS